MISSLATFSALAASQLELLEEQKVAAPKMMGIVGEIQDTLNQYDELSQSIDKIQDRLSYPQARELWRDYRWATRGIHCLIDDYRSKLGEFADTAKANELFGRYLPQIKEALSKAAEILERYTTLAETTKQTIRDTVRDESWRPGAGRGYGYGRGYGLGRGYGYGRGYGQDMGYRHRYGQRWQDQD